MEKHPHLAYARSRSAEARKAAKARRMSELRARCEALVRSRVRADVAKIAAAMLYLGEGSKSAKKSIVTFANADPRVIRLFLRLLRSSWPIEERKLRCTVQCRADQDPPGLIAYWSGVTGVPTTRFYAPQVDPRTKGRPTRRQEYKGVLRIDYLSSMVFNELLLIADAMSEGR
jgi:hypothetical protein